MRGQQKVCSHLGSAYTTGRRIGPAPGSTGRRPVSQDAEMAGRPPALHLLQEGRPPLPSMDTAHTEGKSRTAGPTLTVLGEDPPDGTYLSLGWTLWQKANHGKDLAPFFWPGLRADMTDLCRTCQTTYQKTTQGQTRKAPLVTLLVIAKPFSRVAMDMVGPLPTIEEGYKYILTVCD